MSGQQRKFVHILAAKLGLRVETITAAGAADR